MQVRMPGLQIGNPSPPRRALDNARIAPWLPRDCEQTVNSECKATKQRIVSSLALLAMTSASFGIPEQPIVIHRH
jgi:hypothetical protein